MTTTFRAPIGILTGILLTLAVPAAAQDTAVPSVTATPADLRFVTMYNGTQQANVVGDPTQPGTYAIRVVLPAGLRIRAHRHPESRVVFVASGTMYVAFGDRFDEAALVALPPGSVFTEPAGRPHFTWAKDGEVVLHATGVGPTGTTWMEEALK